MQKKNILYYSWYPLFIPLIFIINELRQDYFVFFTTTYSDKIYFALAILFSNIFVFFLFLLLLKNNHKAGILSIIPLLFIDYYFVFFNIISQITFVENLQLLNFPKIHWVFLFILLVVLLFIFLFLKRSRSRFFKLNLYFNIVFLSFLIVEIFQYYSIEKFNIKLTDIPTKEGDVVFKRNTSSLPDIYFIVFDSYTGNINLNKYWQYDNSEIQDYLKSKKFHLSEAFSNYNYTQLSIASTVNASLLNINKISDFYQTRIVDLIFIIKNNEVFNILKDYNYTYKEMSLFNYKDPYPDGFIFRENLYYRTFYCLIQEKLFGVKTPAFMNYNDSLYADLMGIKKEENPFFLYAHFSIPHSPFIYDSSGVKNTNSNNIFNDYDKEAYLSQLKYTNKVMRKLVENILRNDSNSIIIIQGDHGYRYLEEEENKDLFTEKYSIINAIYLPDHNYSSLPDTMYSVNTFRYIFNSYFGTEFKILLNKKVDLGYKEN